MVRANAMPPPWKQRQWHGLTKTPWISRVSWIDHVSPISRFSLLYFPLFIGFGAGPVTGMSFGRACGARETTSAKFSDQKAGFAISRPATLHLKEARLACEWVGKRAARLQLASQLDLLIPAPAIGLQVCDTYRIWEATVQGRLSGEGTAPTRLCLSLAAKVRGRNTPGPVRSIFPLEMLSGKVPGRRARSRYRVHAHTHVSTQSTDIHCHHSYAIWRKTPLLRVEAPRSSSSIRYLGLRAGCCTVPLYS